MNIKTTSKIWFLLLTICFILNSCIFDTKSAYGIRNCTNDTLLIDLTESSNLDSCWMYWGKHFEDSTGIQPDDTTVVYVHGEKVILSNYYCTQPDSVLFVDPYKFNIKDICYIYAIKWQVATRYTLEEIRAKKLYNRLSVTKSDFHNRMFEYRPEESARNH